MKLKKLCILFLCSISFFLVPAYANDLPKESSDVTIYYDGMHQLNYLHRPYIKDSIVFVPLNETVEMMGGKLSLQESNITISSPDNTLQMKFVLGKRQYQVNSIKRRFKSMPEINHNITYTPLDDIVQFLNIGNSLEYIKSEYEEDVILIRKEKRTGQQKQEHDYSFALNLLNQIPKDKNAVVSPVSMKTALAMAANATTGTTKQEILNALNIENMDHYHKNIKQKADTQQKGVDFISANSIWIQKANLPQGTSGIKKEFLTLLDTYFGGTVGMVNNRSDIKPINDWVEKNTNGAIKEIAQSADFDFMFMNATYFKGSWLYPFYEEATKESTFINQDGSKSNIPFMHQLKALWYYEEASGLKALTLDYGLGEQSPYDMTFVISDQPLDNKKLNQIYQYMDKPTVNLSLPKFSFSNQLDIIPLMKQLGIETIFQANVADFSAMTNVKGLSVTDAIQNTMISVDEKGTETAAVTSISATRCMERNRVVDFIADKPFYFFIRNRDTGEILFEGQFVNADAQQQEMKIEAPKIPDEAEKAIAKVKKAISIPKEYSMFRYEPLGERNRVLHWSFTWSNPHDPYQYIMVRVDEKGEIYRYDYAAGESQKTTKISEKNAEKAGQEFLNKIFPNRKGTWELDYQSLEDEAYDMQYQYYENDSLVKDACCNVRIDPLTGDVNYFRFDLAGYKLWNEKLPVANKISAEKLKESLLTEIGFDLFYNKTEDNNKTSAMVPMYCINEKSLRQAINASTGEVFNTNPLDDREYASNGSINGFYNYGDELKSEEIPMEALPASAYEAADLARKATGMIKENDEIVKAKLLTLDTGDKGWHLYFRSAKEIKFNTTRNRLVKFENLGANAVKPLPSAITDEEAEKAAYAYIKENMPEAYEHINLVSKTKMNAEEITFYFGRIENGIDVMDNFVIIRIDKGLGKMTSFRCKWQYNASFSPLDGILTEGEIYDRYIAQNPYQETYYMDAADKVISAYSFIDKYGFRDDNYYINAFTGEPIS